MLLSLLPLPLEDDGPGEDRDDTTDRADSTGVAVVEDVVDELENRALRLEHLMTAKKFLGGEMAERLSPYFSARFVL